MITILIVDDLDEKVVEISRIIGKFEVPTTILVASDIINARRNLNENIVDIVVLDLYLPVRFGDQIEADGGLLLLKEIQKGKFSSVPKIIFGLSVAHEFNYEGFWPFFRYDSDNKWITPFKTAFNHVKTYQKLYNDEVDYFGFQVYVEGKTDFNIFEKCRALFYDERRDIVFRFENGAGVAWVSRQLLAHCMMLPCDKQSNLPVRCAGVYDADEAGRNALARIDNFLGADAAERRHFKAFVIKKNYSPISKCLLHDDSDCELEDLFCVSLWLWAYENGLLIKRTKSRKLIEIDKASVFNELRYMEELSDEQCETFIDVYAAFECPHENKSTLVSHWLSMDEQSLKKTMMPIKFLLQDIINYSDRK